MKFISVTLIGEIKGRVSQTKKMPDYLLAVNAIKSVSKSLIKEDVYLIYICENYTPTNAGFSVSHAEAKLPNGFVKVIN